MLAFLLFVILQEENAKMVHREAGLVQHVADLEAKMQKFIAGGKNVTEEEICRQDINKIKKVILLFFNFTG